MPETASDTNEKILMKDHDVLIALYTNVGNLMGQVTALSAKLDENQGKNYTEFKAIAIAQTKMEGDIAAIKGEIKDVRDELSGTNTEVGELRKKALGMDVISYFVAGMAALFAWFK